MRGLDQIIDHPLAESLRTGADYLRSYLPENHGVRLAPLVATVDQFLEAMKPLEWPELTMPQIVQED